VDDVHHGGNLCILWDLTFFWRLLSSGVWCCVVWYNSTNVSEKLSASIRTEDEDSRLLKEHGLSLSDYTALLPIWQTPSSSSSIWSHQGPRQQCVEAMNTFSFFVTWSGILSLQPVNKKYNILKYIPPPIVHNGLFCEQHNSLTSKHFMLIWCFSDRAS
jgi:hypothetical protein